MSSHSETLAVGIAVLSSLMYCTELRAPEIDVWHEDLTHNPAIAISVSWPLVSPWLEDEIVIDEIVVMESGEPVFVTGHATVASSATVDSAFQNETFTASIHAAGSMIAGDYSGIPTPRADVRIPEPNTVFLLALGGLAVLKRKRKRA